jgi:hypothetical protein
MVTGEEPTILGRVEGSPGSHDGGGPNQEPTGMAPLTVADLAICMPLKLTRATRQYNIQNTGRGLRRDVVN